MMHPYDPTANFISETVDAILNLIVTSLLLTVLFMAVFSQHTTDYGNDEDGLTTETVCARNVNGTVYCSSDPSVLRNFVPPYPAATTTTSAPPMPPYPVPVPMSNDAALKSESKSTATGGTHVSHKAHLPSIFYYAGTISFIIIEIIVFRAVYHCCSSRRIVNVS